jgi:hypothetical protein
MKKASHFQRVIRQCKFLLKRIKQTNDSLNLSRLKLKLERLIAKYQTNTYLKRLVFGLVISAFPLNEMNGQTIDFNNGIEKIIINNQDGFSINFIDLDNDGDFDVLGYSSPGYGVYNTLHQASNKWNNISPIFLEEVINSNSPVVKNNIDKLFYKSKNSALKLVHLDLNGDSLQSLVIIGEEYLNKNFITVYKQNIENDSIKFDTVPFFHLETNLASNIIDINRDGNIDLINAYANKIHFYLNQGDNANPIFDDLNPTEILMPNNQYLVDFLDYDNDGDYDFEFNIKNYVSSNEFGETSYNVYGGFLENETVGDNIVFTKIDTLALIEYVKPINPEGIVIKFFDLDSDNDLDLIKFISGNSGGVHANYALITWIENETPNSNFVVRGKIKNSDGEAIFTPIVIEPEGIIRWPNYVIDTIENQYISEFNFNLNIGTHKIYPRMPEDGWTSTPEYIEITAVADKDSITNQDFILNCTPGKEDFKIVASTFNVARPGFEHIQNSNILNLSDKDQELIVAWKPDERLEIINTDDQLDSMVNGVYYFTFLTNALGNGILNNEVKVPVNVSIGDTLKSYYQLMPNEDANPENNSFELVDVVVGSWDPNDKIVSPKGTGDEGITDIENKEFTYTIRFQNTGNYTAENVVLLDTIDEKFDMKTFKTLNLPGYFQYNVGNFYENYCVEINENVVMYIFQEINLPPQSENEFASQGYVQYSVKLKEDIQPGEIIKNKADIYFDFNNPITTNETIN